MTPLDPGSYEFSHLRIHVELEFVLTPPYLNFSKTDTSAA